MNGSPQGASDMSIFVRCYELLTLISVALRGAAGAVIPSIFTYRMIGAEFHPRIISITCSMLAVTASIGIAASLTWLSPRMNPLRKGTSDRFWYVATGVQLSPGAQVNLPGKAEVFDDRWAVYEECHAHGSEIYYVPYDNVKPDLANVLAELELRRDRNPESPTVAAYVAYVSWRDQRPSPENASGLVNLIQDRHLKSSEHPDIAAWHNLFFQQKWMRAKWYWVRFPFEWVYLSGLIVFLLWPAIMNQPCWNWAWRLACSPILFMTPAYLGYATWSVTGDGPTGGIVYPFLLRLLGRGSLTQDELYLLRHMPPLLEPASDFSAGSIYQFDIPLLGPVSAIALGLQVAALLIISRVCVDLRKSNTASELHEIQVEFNE
jgi:hypothetical protein